MIADMDNTHCYLIQLHVWLACRCRWDLLLSRRAVARRRPVNSNGVLFSTNEGFMARLIQRVGRHETSRISEQGRRRRRGRGGVSVRARGRVTRSQQRGMVRYRSRRCSPGSDGRASNRPAASSALRLGRPGSSTTGQHQDEYIL